MGENRISHLVDTLDISKMTPEQQKKEEEEFLRNCYICDKCRSLHMHSTDLAGKVCFPHEGDHYCDGILRKAKDLDDVFKRNGDDEGRSEQSN